MTALGRSSGQTHTGRKRRHNEDAYVCEPPLFAVADGMGGANAGEVASGLAAAALAEHDTGEATGSERVAALIQEANRRVWTRSNEDETAAGMGTTVTAALVENGHVVLGHVGDSRAYRVRGGELEQLTEDHSLVAELMRSGKLSAEEAETHPQRSVITRALGTDPDVDIDTFVVEAQVGDIYRICSDGLTSMVDDATILGVVERRRNDLDALGRELISAANKGGGEDNITVVCFEIADELDATVELSAPTPVPVEMNDDEDTLDESDAVPVVSTMVIPPGQLDIAVPHHDEPGSRRLPERRARVLPMLLLLLAVVVIAALVWWGLSR
ncbi:MAG: Stp1/IreP family PP2C-type Ser/Thr phosphatase [Gaiellaceae bacterium]